VLQQQQMVLQQQETGVAATENGVAAIGNWFMVQKMFPSCKVILLKFLFPATLRN